MKRFFTQDTVLVGLVAGLGSELLFCLLLAAGLIAAGQWPPSAEQTRWFGGMFIPLLLILRAYAKTKRHLTVTKTLATVLFVTFVAFMFYLLNTNTLTLKPINT